MKLITFTRRGSTAEELGLMRGEGVLPLREAGFSYADMNDLICRSSKEDLAAMAAAEGAELALDEITLLSPIPRPLQDVLCLGLNYAAHAQEASGFSRDAFGVELAAPIFFSKRVNYSQGSGAPIPAHRDLTAQLDFENELAVVIGRDADHVPEAQVWDYDPQRRLRPRGADPAQAVALRQKSRGLLPDGALHRDRRRVFVPAGTAHLYHAQREADAGQPDGLSDPLDR